jgi:hypothetical protein
MPRLGSRGCLIALLGMAVLACNKTDASTGGLGSPNASGAGREAASPSASDQGTSTANDGLARSLVAVAVTSPTDAQPCERTCGRIGDCLIEADDDSSSPSYQAEFEAGRQELECLDLCVHADESAAPRSAFLACEQQSGCGEFLGCARSNWSALVATRTGPSVQGGSVVVGGNGCGHDCRLVYSCIFTHMLPGQAPLPQEYEETVRYCETQCETSPTDREMWAQLSDCLRDNCSADRQNVCFGGY